MSFEDYPFDPKLRASDSVYVDGLEKLRYVENREWAKSLYDLYQTIHNPTTAALKSRREKEKKREEVLDMARRAHAGKLGYDEQELALTVFGDTFNELVTREELGRFWRGMNSIRQARANRAEE